MARGSSDPDSGATKVNGEVVSDRTHVPTPLHPPLQAGRIGLFHDRGPRGIPLEVSRIDMKN
jgi:hypothetical protein